MEKQLQDLQQQQQDYQHEVTEHFVETARLLHQLTDSYQDVHNHLAKGAQLLAGNRASESMQAITADIKNTEIEYDEDDEISAPLDYAPKSPNQPGVLNEEFGLQKTVKEGELESPASALK